jgi:hypothetical protein
MTKSLAQLNVISVLSADPGGYELVVSIMDAESEMALDTGLKSEGSESGSNFKLTSTLDFEVGPGCGVHAIT